MMAGRVKTLHPLVHGGILGRRGLDDPVMRENGIQPIDLVVVNLYPFEQTVAKPGCDLETAIENIDIGGPTLLRAAAKNHAAVTVVVDAADYGRVLTELAEQGGAVTDATRFDLAVKVFEHTARYDGAIANYLGRRLEGGEPLPYPRTLQPPVPAQAGHALRRKPPSGRRLLHGGRLQCHQRRHRDPDPGQGTLLQQHRRHGRGPGVCQAIQRGPGLRHRQARQPLRRRPGRQSVGGLRTRLRHGPGIRLRRHHRRQRRTGRGHRQWPSPSASSSRSS